MPRLDKLTKKRVKKEIKNVVIERVPDKVVSVPEDMQLRTVIRQLTDMANHEEQEVRTSFRTGAYATEGAVAFSKALAELFGFTKRVPEMTMFGANPPREITVQTDIHAQTVVPWGTIQLPGVPGQIATGLYRDGGRVLMMINGTTIQREKAVHEALGDRVKELVRTESIYKGKPIEVDFSVSPDDEEYDPFLHVPKFIDVRGVEPSELIFSESVAKQINMSLFTPIRYMRATIQAGVPQRRGILLHGDYGCGKTMTAAVAAYYCKRAGVTFIKARVTEIEDVRRVMLFARDYEPSVVFIEDIDRVITGTRTLSMDEILNVIDGVDTKDAQVMKVFTSNHPELINKAVLRPGRIDAIIEVSPPDAGAVTKLMHLYGRGLIPEAEDLKPAAEQLAGLNPATVREAVERAKLAALDRTAGDPINELLGVDLLPAAEQVLKEQEFRAEQSSETRVEDLLAEVDRRVVEVQDPATTKKGNGQRRRPAPNTAL